MKWTLPINSQRQFNRTFEADAATQTLTLGRFFFLLSHVKLLLYLNILILNVFTEI